MDNNLNQKNKNLALAVIAVFLGMTALSFASVPIYNIFCKVTGFAGTTQVAAKSSTYTGTRNINVKFDSNIDSKLNWKFIAKQDSIKVKTGQNAIAFYYAENKSNNDIIGTSVYNVTPHIAAKYFHKIQCFCFTEQLLKSGQKMLMPVTFYIDPEIEKDYLLKDLDEITLSYTFYLVKEQ